MQGSDVTAINDSSASGTLRMMTAALNTSNERPPQDPMAIQQQQQVSIIQRNFRLRLHVSYNKVWRIKIKSELGA